MVKTMVERQCCFEIKEVGANLDKEHSVFNLVPSRSL